jgi:hypothetical protein
MKLFEMGPRPEQKTEVQGINQGYNIMKNIKERLRSNDITSAQAELERIKSLKHLIEQNLPPLNQEQKTSVEGFYSPAHMMHNTVRYVEEAILRKSEAEIPKVIVAADQAMRLMAHGMYEKSQDFRDITSRITGETFRLPNLIEIPVDWKKSQEGQNFSKNFNEFIERRKQNKLAEQTDIDLINAMIALIGKSYEGKTIDRHKAETSPYTRELILINLELLGLECSKYKGRVIPGSREILNAVQLIKGLFNYNERAEISQRTQSSFAEYQIPPIIDQPEKLRT